jgi:formylglycine-generating enzyme required for sulfatase activity
MSNTSRQPRPDDAVLGEQYQAPIDGAVLGGIEGVRQRLAIDNIEIKKVALTQALNYGEKGVQFLFEVLEKESNLDVYWSAYQLLEKQNNSATQIRLKNYFPCYEFESVTVNCRGEIIKRTPGKAKYFREDLGNGIYLDMTYIPGGTFLMGSPESEEHSDNDERPQHLVTIPPFWMGKYAVTQEQWQAIMGNNPSFFRGAKLPVETVNWHECQQFCQKLSQRTGKAYDLPNEGQREYGCRAGTTTPFHFGETITTDLANYNGDYTYAEAGKGIYRGETVEVGQFPPNAFGLYEMHGNVSEWCEYGWYESSADKPTNLQQDSNIISSSNNESRDIVRGGSWNYFPSGCRSAHRHGYVADLRYSGYGFRLVISIGPSVGVHCGSPVPRLRFLSVVQMSDDWDEWDE